MKKTIVALAAIAFAAPVLAADQSEGGNPNPNINMSGTRYPGDAVVEYPSRVTVPTTVIESPARAPHAAVITYPNRLVYSQVVLPKDSDKKRNRKPISGARGYEASVSASTVAYVSRR